MYDLVLVIRDKIFPVIYADSDSETSSLYSNASRGAPTILTEKDQLLRSLSKVEKEQGVSNKLSISLTNSIKSAEYLYPKYNLLSKIMLSIPFKGIALSQVFSEASLVQKKNNLMADRLKREENTAKFHQLRNTRLEILDRLEELD